MPPWFNSIDGEDILQEKPNIGFRSPVKGEAKQMEPHTIVRKGNNIGVCSIPIPLEQKKLSENNPMPFIKDVLEVMLVIKSGGEKDFGDEG